MKREIRFVKYHGCGNDFVIIDEISRSRTNDVSRSMLARKLTDRHFHIGADGVMFLEGAGGCDCSMRLFEPAGNEAVMCGNGIRCVAAYVMGKIGGDAVDIMTLDGPKRITRSGREFRVEMGEIRTKRRDLKGYITDRGEPDDSMMSGTFRANGRTYRGSIVNSGEPHIVIRVGDVEDVDMVAIGESLNADRKRFPKGVNVNFVSVNGKHTIKVRTYERGVYDETLACGTGATAAAAVALMRGWVQKGKVRVSTRGGRLTIELDKDRRARMTGPAEKVYSGEIVVNV